MNYLLTLLYIIILQKDFKDKYNIINNKINKILLVHRLQLKMHLVKPC